VTASEAIDLVVTLFISGACLGTLAAILLRLSDG
jgi:hypothetical protein